MRPFRFGVVAAQARSGAEWAEKARRVEALGYATLLMPDTIEHSLAPLVALGYAANATRSLRLGSYVFANDYRPPVLLAKDAATLDLLSGGRFELGLGAGRPSAERDYRMLGVPFAAGGTRVARLAESLAIVKRLLAGEPLPALGPHYALEEAQARISPLPVQRPLPIVVAGSGRRLLELAAREADTIALGVMPDATEAAVAEKVGWIRAAAAGRAELPELNVNLMAVGGRVVSFLARQFGERAAAFAGSDAVSVLHGTTDEQCETLIRRRETLGISYFAVGEELLEELAPVVARLAGR